VSDGCKTCREKNGLVVGISDLPTAVKALNQLLNEVHELQSDNKDLQQTIELCCKADLRAIKAWQEAHPGNDLVWPDRARLVEWLITENTDLHQRVQQYGVVVEAHKAIFQHDEVCQLRYGCGECERLYQQLVAAVNAALEVSHE
jgi:hypothetical protein